MLSRVALLWCLTTLLFGSLCYSDKESVAVVGVAECVGCAQNNIEPRRAFSGLHVAIVCKGFHGKFETKGTGELTQDGKFKVSVPNNMIIGNRGGGAVQLKQQCVAQLLHSATGAPCPNPTGQKAGLEAAASKFEIIFKSTDNGKHTFSPIRNLSFSPLTCTTTSPPTIFANAKIPKITAMLRVSKCPCTKATQQCCRQPKPLPKPKCPCTKATQQCCRPPTSQSKTP